MISRLGGFGKLWIGLRRWDLFKLCVFLFLLKIEEGGRMVVVDCGREYVLFWF